MIATNANQLEYLVGLFGIGAVVAVLIFHLYLKVRWNKSILIMTDIIKDAIKVDGFKFILQNNEEVEITISQMGKHFGMEVSRMPENFAIYNSGYCFGSIGALIFCESLAQSHSSCTNNAKKVVISQNQLKLIQEYLNWLPDKFTTYSFEYSYQSRKYIPRCYETMQDKQFPPKNIELVLV